MYSCVSETKAAAVNEHMSGGGRQGFEKDSEKKSLRESEKEESERGIEIQCLCVRVCVCVCLRV